MDPSVAVTKSMETAFDNIRFHLRERLSLSSNAELSRSAEVQLSGKDVLAIVKESLRNAAEETIKEMARKAEEQESVGQDVHILGESVEVDSSSAADDTFSEDIRVEEEPIRVQQKHKLRGSQELGSFAASNDPDDDDDERGEGEAAFDVDLDDADADADDGSYSYRMNSEFHQKSIHKRYDSDVSDISSYINNPSPNIATLVTSNNRRRTFLRVCITSAEKQNDGMFASFILYTIKTALVIDDPAVSDLPKTTNIVVYRRYSDFDLLSQQIKTWAKGVYGNDDLKYLRSPLIPSLPKKRKFRVQRNTSEEHAEDRRISLEFWLKHLITHPMLRSAVPLRIFLAASSNNVHFNNADMSFVTHDDWIDDESHKWYDSTRIRDAGDSNHDLKKMSKQADRLMTPLENALERADGFVALLGEKVRERMNTDDRLSGAQW